MGTPRIALRFRDATPGIDTIAEHLAVIRSKGAAWWGWWRKETEPQYTELFADLMQRGAGEVYLVDRSTNRCYLARYLIVFGGASATIDSKRVPEYYREQIAEISGWFLLDRIQQDIYNPEIGRRLGESTLLILDRTEIAESPGAYARSVKGSAILHLSDLHFGADYAFLPPDVTAAPGIDRTTLTKSLLEDLERVGVRDQIGAVLVTGDFTTQGDWSDETRNQILLEFEALCQALKIDSAQVIPIPGNHDIVRYPAGVKKDIQKITVDHQTTYQHERDYRTFIDELTRRSWRDPLNFYVSLRLTSADVVLCALNSCTITATEWTEYGYVGVSGIDVLGKIAAMPVERATYRLMALHHHLIPVSQVEMPHSRGVSLTLDAVHLLDEAQRAGIQIALHGHQHLPRVALYERVPLLGDKKTAPILIVSGGSAGAVAARRPGSERNTYSLLLFGEEAATLKMRELRPDKREGASLYDGRLPITPIRP